MMGKFIASLMLAVCISGSAHAETGSSGSPFALQGFGTIGLVRSSSDHAEFVRDLSQPVGIKGGQWSGRIDSILGLQANWQATPEIELVGQVVSRLHYDRSHNPELMWAFAKWEPDPRLSLRAGRIGADFMMLADSRLVGYSYLPVRPSGDYFGPLFFSHFDGVDASATLPLGSGLLRGKVFAGKTQEKAAGEPGIWDTSGSPVRGIVLDYVTGPWQFRANAASIRFAGDIYTYGMPDMLRAAGIALNIPAAIAAADSLLSKGTTTRYYSLGVVYDNGPLQVQGMLNRIRHETKIFEPSHAGYLLAGYRFAAVTPYVGVSWWRSQPRTYTTGLPEPAFTDLNQGYLGFIAGARVDQTTYTLGTRWDLRNNMALKFQWDAIRGNSVSRFSFQRSDPEWNGKTNVLTVTLDFVF